MDTLTSLLPGPGLLPKWLLLVSITAAANAVQSYLTLSYTTQVYPGTWRPIRTTPTSPTPSPAPKTIPTSSADLAPLSSPATGLSSRTFGTWTFLSAVIRFYGAYNISNPVVYEMVLWTYVLAVWHFGTEWLVFRTTSWGRGLAGPVMVGLGSTVWMVVQRGAYVEGKGGFFG